MTQSHSYDEAMEMATDALESSVVENGQSYIEIDLNY